MGQDTEDALTPETKDAHQKLAAYRKAVCEGILTTALSDMIVVALHISPEALTGAGWIYDSLIMVWRRGPTAFTAANVAPFSNTTTTRPMPSNALGATQQDIGLRLP